MNGCQEVNLERNYLTFMYGRIYNKGMLIIEIALGILLALFIANLF